MIGLYGTHSFFNRNIWHGLRSRANRFVRGWLEVPASPQRKVHVNTVPQWWQKLAAKRKARAEFNMLWHTRRDRRTVRKLGLDPQL